MNLHRTHTDPHESEQHQEKLAEIIMNLQRSTWNQQKH